MGDMVIPGSFRRHIIRIVLLLSGIIIALVILMRLSYGIVFAEIVHPCTGVLLAFAIPFGDGRESSPSTACNTFSIQACRISVLPVLLANTPGRWFYGFSQRINELKLPGIYWD
jgi:hypothetical protein